VDDEGDLRGGLCVDCFILRNPVMQVAEVIDQVRCPTCGAMQGRGGWTSPTGNDEGGDGEALQHAVAAAAEAAVEVVDGGRLRSLDVRVHQEARSVFSVDLSAEVELMGQVTGAQATTRVRIKGELCPVCSRRSGQYYEALIQFRGTPERPPTERELQRARAYVMEELERLFSSSRDVFLVKEEAIHGGLDFYISTHAAAAQIARGLVSMFSASSASTTTMAGRRDGKDVVRVTHAVRLPELRRGDYVMLGDRLLRVLSASPKEATVEPAGGPGRRRHLTRRDRASLVLVGDSDSPEEAVVVSSSEGEVQVLDPVSMRTVVLLVPEDYILEGRETVRVVRSADTLHIVE